MARYIRCLSAAGAVAMMAGIAVWAQQSRNTMQPGFYHSSPQDIRTPPLPPLPIHNVRAGTLAPAPSIKVQGTYRRFSNSERNSRLPYRVPHTTLQAIAQIDLGERSSPRAVLAGGGRLVIQTADGWLLLDRSGRRIQSGTTGEGEITMDPRSGVVYAPTDSGYIGAYSLADGARRYFLTAFFGEEFRRELIERRDGRMLIVSVELPAPPHSRAPAQRSVIEIQDLSAREEIGESGRLRSAHTLDYLISDTAQLVTAMHDRTLVLATEKSIYFADPALHLERELGGKFHPLLLSLDELLRCYLVVELETGSALWVINPAGERWVNVALPPELSPIMPPVVGLDHTAYVIGKDQVLAVDVAGSILWRRTEAAGIAGAVATDDGNLLVCSGSELAAYDRAGKRSRLFSVPGDTLTTAPAIGEEGELLVAGRLRLYVLR